MYEPLEASVRRWGTVCHLVGLLSIVLCSLMPIPFLGALPPYAVWRMGRDQHPFIDDQGREAINFQITMTIYLLVATILWVFLTFTTCMAAMSGRTSGNVFGNLLSWLLIAGAGILTLFGLFMVSVIIFAAIKASQGQSYRYPFTMRFLQ